MTLKKPTVHWNRRGRPACLPLNPKPEQVVKFEPGDSMVSCGMPEINCPGCMQSLKTDF